MENQLPTAFTPEEKDKLYSRLVKRCSKMEGIREKLQAHLNEHFISVKNKLTFYIGCRLARHYDLDEENLTLDVEVNQEFNSAVGPVITHIARYNVIFDFESNEYRTQSSYKDMAVPSDYTPLFSLTKQFLDALNEETNVITELFDIK